MQKQLKNIREISASKNSNIFCASLILITVTFITVACSSGDTETGDEAQGAPPPNIQSGTQEDPLAEINIAKRLYLNQRIPDDFYHEPERDENNFYTIQHIKSTTVLPYNQNIALTPAYEVCTDNFAQAFDWSEQATLELPSYAGLIDNQETDIFYEFTRVNLSAPQFIRLNRIFKCSFINREDAINTEGSLNTSPLNQRNLKTAAEYLWTISSHNNYGYAVLLTNSLESEAEIQHILIEARMQMSTTENQCDNIHVFKINYRINKTDRKIHMNESELKQFSAKYQNGLPTICNN